MARRKTFYRVVGNDGHFKFQDRMPSHSDGHLLFARVDTAKDALAMAWGWMQSNPVQDSRKATLHIEEVSPRGDWRVQAKWTGESGMWVMVNVNKEQGL
jgi:hypothetical protein